MYLDYWKLNTKPFENTPDPRFYYPSSQHEEALSRLLFAVQEGKGAAMLTGDFGCGKTLIAQELLDKLGYDTYKFALINNPLLTPIEFLRSIAARLGAADLPATRSELMADVILENIETILTNNFKDGKNTLVIIDEMHVVVEKQIFEQLRMLLNFQLRDRFLLSLLLLGQPELKNHIETNKQFLQRIAIRFHLGPMDAPDTAGYIQHRLGVAGADRAIFSAGASSLIHKKTGGIPRRINQMCDLSLMTGMHLSHDRIDEDTVEEVAADVGI